MIRSEQTVLYVLARGKSNRSPFLKNVEETAIKNVFGYLSPVPPEWKRVPETTKV